jgi:hypothetical protein
MPPVNRMLVRILFVNADERVLLRDRSVHRNAWFGFCSLTDDERVLLHDRRVHRNEWFMSL